MPFDSAMATLFNAELEAPVLPVLPSLTERYPVRFLRVALEQSRPGTAVAHYLRGLIMQRPEVVEAARPHLSAGAISRLEALWEAVQPQLPAAKLNHLPALFRDPPWKRAKARRPKALKVEVATLTDRVKFSDTDESDLVFVRREIEQLRGMSDEQLAKEVRKAWYHRPVLQVFCTTHEGQIGATALEDIRTLWLEPEELRQFTLAALILHNPTSAFELVRSAASEPHKALIEFAPLAEPRVAAGMLDGLAKVTVRPAALAWARRHPEYAAASWAPIALGGRGKARDRAEEALRFIANVHSAELVLKATAVYGDEAVALVHAILSQDPLEALPAKRPKTLGFCNPVQLPQLALKDQELALPTDAAATAAMVLAMSSLDQPYAGVEVLKETLDPPITG